MESAAADRRLIGQGREAEVFALSGDRVLKLLRARAPLERLESEVAALEAARLVGIRVPKVYERILVDGRPGFVMERVHGSDLLTALSRQPWLVWRGGGLAGEVHARINGIQAPPSLPGVRNVLYATLERIEAQHPSLHLEWIQRILARLPDGDALCHGDFHPGQLVYAGGDATVLDWSSAKRGDALFDYARTQMLLGMAELPPGTSRYVRLLAAMTRRLFLASYTRSYELLSGRPIDRARVRDWRIVNLASRLSENISSEWPYLRQHLRALQAAAQNTG